MDLKLDKILKLTPDFWLKIGEWCIEKITTDVEQGIFQTDSGKSSKGFYNAQYAKYKANAMRRFRSKFKGKTVVASKLKKSASGGFMSGNKNLAAYSGRSVNSDILSVNMNLTGRLLGSFKVKGQPTDRGVTIGFSNADNNAKKLIGNEQKYNRKLLGLNPQNKAMVKEMIIDQLEENIREWAREKINITVG